MKDRYLKILFVLAAVSISLAASTQVIAQRYSGRASAVRATVGVPLTNPVTTVVNDTGQLPAAGGNITLSSASASILGGALTVGASSSATRGGSPAGTSHSETSVANLSFTVLGNTITAAALATSTDCSCPTQTCTGTTTITGLTLNGSAVIVTGAANQTILLMGPGGVTVGTVIINEQISGLGSRTVNAIHVNVTDSATGISTDVVVASSHSDIICEVFPTASFFSGRAYGVGSTVATQDIVLGTSSSVTTLVDDTGPLPPEGGMIGPVVVAGANIAGLLTSGTLTSSTSGGLFGVNRVADSSSSVQTLSATVAGFTITAMFLNSQTHCQCSTTGGNTSSTCTGGAVITNLVITSTLPGSNIRGTVTGAPNNMIQLRIGSTVVATITLNEQIPASLRSRIIELEASV
ncbi:MAG: choice-of-anchor P family protein, partial [Acidobacteriota bacterium]